MRIRFSIINRRCLSLSDFWRAGDGERIRSLGAKLVNRDGKVFMHPLETRDVAAASIIRECSDREEGVDTGKWPWRLAGYPDD